MMSREISASRIASIVYSIKSFIGYCENFLQIPALDLNLIRPPKEVIYLNIDEINRFIETIDLNIWHELRLRVLVEAILGTGMRISEAISLNRNHIDWEKKEAKLETCPV